MTILKQSYNSNDPLEVSEFLAAIVATWANANEGPSTAKRAIEDMADTGPAGVNLLVECGRMIDRYHVGASDMRLFPLNVIAGRPVPVSDILKELKQELGVYVRRSLV
jgi:hypothetical protein